MQSNLEGRLRNFRLEKKDAPFCIYETVVNGFQSYPEASEKKYVKVTIGREDLFGNKNTGLISSITVSDEGEGFTDENLKAFKTLDETTKPQLRCKGVGRLTCLKVFSRVKIKSRYVSGDKVYRRDITFDPKNEVQVSLEELSEDILTTGSEVSLVGKLPGSLEDKVASSEAIRNGLLSHYLKFLITEQSNFDVLIQDEGVVTSLQDELKSKLKETPFTEEIQIGGHCFSLTHILLKDIKAPSYIAWCGNGRVVLLDPKTLNLLSGISNALKNQGEGLTYICMVESKYLDDATYADRSNFSISENDDSLGLEELSFPQIKRAIEPRIRSFLKELVEKEKLENFERLEYWGQELPSFKPIIDLDKNIEIPKGASRREALKILRRTKYEMADEVDDLIESSKQSIEKKGLAGTKEAVTKIFEDLMSHRAVALNKSALAEYVVRRKAIIECFDQALSSDFAGEVKKEEFIHNLIIPMKCDSSNMYFEESNLWLLDEQLAFHNYISSDIPLNQIKIAEIPDDLRPDVATLKLCSYEEPIGIGTSVKGSISIVEFKKPTRKDVKGSVDQVIGYAEKLTENKLRSYNKRPVRCEGPVFGYIVCDIDSSFEKYLRTNRGFKKVDNGFFYSVMDCGGFALVLEVLSLDYVLERARRRNQALFKVLGLE